MKINYKTGGLKVIKQQERCTDNEVDYAVFKCEFPDKFDAIALRKNDKHKVKIISLICFIPSLFSEIEENETYIFTGFISFGYGSTFLVVEDFYCPKTGVSWAAKEDS